MDSHSATSNYRVLASRRQEFEWVSYAASEGGYLRPLRGGACMRSEIFTLTSLCWRNVTKGRSSSACVPFDPRSSRPVSTTGDYCLALCNIEQPPEPLLIRAAVRSDSPSRLLHVDHDCSTCCCVVSALCRAITLFQCSSFSATNVVTTHRRHTSNIPKPVSRTPRSLYGSAFAYACAPSVFQPCAAFLPATCGLY